MIYYKIIQENKVVSAGFVFLKWNEVRRKMNICNENEAQFVQAFDQSHIYRDEWLKPVPLTCSATYEMAQVIVIDKSEFEDIQALLDGDETIPVLQPVEPAEEELIEPEKPVEETPLSISDMRRIIQQQQDQIMQLSEKLTEVSDAIRK